jgi:CubicO group peptidase (beta-lactamase class C family)
LLNDDEVKRLLDRAQLDIDMGLLPSCQLALGYQGEIVMAETLGDATSATRYAMFSCTKPIVASAAWQLIGQGLLDPDRTVASYISEFGTNGKDVVTVEQLMVHSGGFPKAIIWPSEWGSRSKRLDAFSEWELEWTPGTRYEYHPGSAHWVLAELVERLSGFDYRRVVNERIAGALGLTKLRLGVPPEDQHDIIEFVLVGAEATEAEMIEAFGMSELPPSQVNNEIMLAFNRPEFRAVGVPAGSGVTTASDLALFYQALLHNPRGLWNPAVLADATGRVRNKLPDVGTGIPANRSLGLMIAGDDGNSWRRGMGRNVSAGAFGHDGFGGQVAWADPATGLSFVYLTNGIDIHAARQAQRVNDLASSAALCGDRL